MIEDKARWNKKYETALMPEKPIKALVKLIDKELITSGKALDIACGMGRHTHYLAYHGFEVDAVDISDVALQKIDCENSAINCIEADLDSYTIEKDAYDLIICTNFLSRRLIPYIKEGLRVGGYVVFETFVAYEHTKGHRSTNPDYNLRVNELLHNFISLEVISYKEKVKQNLKGEWVKVATLVAKR